MKLSGIKRHLTLYSIYGRRKTTMNHAFASALAPSDSYDEERITEALSLLGQDTNRDLTCVYCNETAQTWDHLVGLVKDSQLYGYGHQIGNLVPSCKQCNSQKGNKDWRVFLEEIIPDGRRRHKVKRQLSKYVKRYAQPLDITRITKRHPRKWKKFEKIKEEIFDRMKEADKLAEKLRQLLT